MLYKTIVLELLEQRPRLHEELKQQRKLLATVGQYATELKASHEARQAELSLAKPESDPIQIASEALEMALKELEDRLPKEFPEDVEPELLEETMTFLRRHTPPA